MFKNKRKAKIDNRWESLNKKDLKNLANFLIPKEPECVPFTSSISNKRKIRDFYSKNDIIFVEKEENKIISALIITKDRDVCPVFSAKTKLSGLEKLIRKTKIYNKKYLILIGNKAYIKKLESFLSLKILSSINYYLLSVNSTIAINTAIEKNKQKHPEIFNKLKICIAQKKDLNLLLPLRYAYELEEVVTNPENFNYTACKKRFSKTVTKGNVFFAKIDNIPVATCCINLKGINWCLLGGVFTKPEFRSMGISTTLIGATAQFLSRENKNLCLFVKEHNKPAIELYKKCGFTHSCEYRISYCDNK